MVNNDQQQEKPQDFELMELLFSKIDSSTSDAADSLDKSFEARYQSLVDQIQSYLHSSEKPGFFPHRFLGSFSSVLDTKLNDKLGIKKLHFRFEGARTLKVVAETESKTHVFIFTEEIEAQHSYSPQTRTKNFEFTTGEWKNVMGRDYTPLDERKLQIDVIKILKDKYELVKSKPKSDKDVKSKKLYLYVKKDGVLEYVAKDIHGGTKAIQINRDELKGNNAFKDKFFDEIKQFLRSGKDLSDDVRKELSRITSAKGYTLKSDGEDEKINIKVESKKKIVDQPIEPTVKFQKVTKKMGKSIYLEDYIEKLVNSDTRQAKENLEDILNYIKKVHANLDLQDNVYGIKAREADQHGFVAGVFDNFRYRDNTKLYLEQFAGGGYADIVLLVRGPNRAVDSVPILIELKAGTEGQVDPSDALRQAEDYIKGFRPNKMRILTNADNAIAVGLNLDNAEPFKTEVKPIKQPSSPLMEKILTDIRDWDGSQHTRAQLEEQIKSALSSEYHTFPANKETKDHYYFSRDILGQSILINKIGQDQGNVKKYIYSYGEYPLDWSGGTEYTLSKSPVTTLIFVQGNEGQEKTAFIFHIRESNTKEFYADKKIPVLNIPGIGEVKNVIETKMSLRKYETGLSFEELFEIEQISKYKPSGADQQFAGSFLKIPNSDELKVKFDQAITSQHASDGEVSLQAYKVLLTEVADAVYPIKDLITNEARLQAVLNGLLSSYSDLKLQETSAKTVIIPEFQVGAGGRVDMVIQGIGPSPQGTKEYTPIALEFKLIDKNLDEKGMKKEVDKLTKEQNVRYAKGAALKAITDSDKMFFMGVVVNVKAKDKNSLILTSDEFVPALVVHSSIDIAKRKHLEGIQEVTQRLKNTGIQEENLRTLESATAEQDYHYWLQQHDIADIARIKYGYGADTLFEIVGSPEHIVNQLQQFQNSVRGGEKRPLTLIVNLDNNHWVTLVISHQNGQYNGYYVDSLNNSIPGNIRQVLQQAQITINDISVTQQKDGYNCGLWALENARDINAVLQGGRSNIPNEIRNRLQGQGRDENYFIRMREDVSEALSIDPQRIANLDEAILAETQAPRKKFNLNSCVKPGGRSKRSVNSCLFSKDDVEKFSKGKVDENNVDKIIVDSEKFLTYVKNSQDEAKNAQLVEFVGDKNIEGDRKYLLDKVVGDQGYERYVQNERIKDLHGDISQQDSGLTKNPKLKGRLMTAAGGIQLIRGIHGAIVSCQDGVTTDCGLNLGGIGWSFASQPIENAMVKVTPKVLASVEKVVGKIPGVLGKQTKFAVQVAGVKFGSKIAGGAAGAITGVFDIVDIGMSANNLVDCKKRENSDNPCGEKEIRDNIATISFSTVSFVSGVALTALSMPGVGIAAGVALMVASGVYSGVSNIVEYEKKYDTTHGENWRIFWHTFAFQPIPEDVQHLAARKEIVNRLTKEAWKTLNDSSDNVVAYAFGLGRVSGNILSSSSAEIFMNKKDTAYTKNLSRVIPDNIEGASMICLLQITNQDYEKGITSSVPSAVYYCENAVVISRSNTNQANPTIIYDLQNVVDGRIIGSNEWNNNFLINKSNIEITGSNNVVTGGDNVVNKFVFLDTPSSSGKVIGGRNSTNILDLSEAKKDRNIRVAIQDNIVSGNLKVRINGRVLVNSVDPSNYYYVGRKRKMDEILCMGHSTHSTRHEVIVDSGGVDNSEKDVVENCKKVIILPYTTVKGGKSNCTFYVETGGYKGRDLRSEIVGGTGTIFFSEFDLLSDCDQITYSTSSNTLSLKINFGQNNQFTLDIKNYVEQSSNKPHFVLIDKNGSNIVPKVEKLDSSTIRINSFELHSEHSLDNFGNVETHYKKILKNNKDYKVLGVIRGKTQSQDNSVVPHIVFGSSGDDLIYFDQGTIFARGGKGSDVYVIADDINKKEVKIDNHSDDEKADTLFTPEVEKDFSVQQCDLHLNYSNTDIQVKNYFQDRNYRHLIIMNKKGEAFIPNVQSMSCSSSGKGKLVPFLQATQTQNIFLLPKDFADDHVVIDSRLEDIKKYKDKDDLLLIRESEIPFIIRMEGFYTDRSKWESISYSLWNNNDFVPSSGLLENVDNVMEYKDKLRNDYERIVKEYTEDFSDSTSIIQHNQKLEENISTSIRQDEERIGVMVLKNITPDQVEVSSSGTDLIFRDKRSNHKINIKGWESYRISKLEFDLGLEPIKILRLNRFSLSEVKEIQSLIDKASQNYQSREEYTSRVEDDFRCLISIHSLMKKPIYQCSGFFSLQDQANFVKSACNREQIEEFENKMPSTSQFMMLLEKLHNDLSLNGYNQDTIDKCSRVVTSGFGVLNLWINKAVDEDKWDEVQTLLDRTANRSNADVEHKSKCSKSWTLLNYFVYNGNVDLGKDIFKLILKKSGSIDALEDGNGWAALHYAVHYGDFNMASFLVDEGAKVDVKNKEGKTPLYLVIEEAKKNKLDMIKLLVERGADIEAKDNDGKSPLYLITYSGDLDTIKLLFEMIKAKDNSSLKTIKEIDSLRRKIFNQQNIPFYVRSFVDSYVSGVVQTVAKELRDNVSMHGCAAIVKFGDEIYEFNKELFKEIIREFISVVYGKTLNSDGILECINSYNHTEEKIYSYIALLDEMKRNDHLSDNAAFKLAYNVKEIIGSGEKYDLREIKNRLPGCVNDVVFPSKVCIKNVNFGEYLYPTDTKVTDDRRVVATDSISRATWKIEFKDGKFYIISNEGEYLYAADYAQYDDERRSVFTWVGGDQVKNDEWNIIPKGDICDLVNVGQREYLYSPVDYFKGKYSGGEMFPGLRPVFTWIGGSQVTNSEWKFEDCSRSRRKRDVEELESEVSLDSRPFQVVRGRENSNDTQFLELSARLQNNLLPSSHSDEGIVHWYSRPGNEDMLNKMMSSVLASVKGVIYPDQLNSRLDLDSCSKNNASSCPPLMRNIYNTINLDKKNIFTGKENVLEITSGYERLDIENFPVQEKVINVNRKRSLLDLSKLVKQVDVDLGIKPIPMIVKEKNDLLIKLSISATGLKKDVVTVRLKGALINNSYKNLQIVFDSAPVEIDNNLKLTPSILISDSKIIVVTPQNIEEGNKLIICREIEGYTFLHHKYDLIMTNALSANVSEKELYVMYFKDFYREPKMQKLSIRFIDKEILLSDKMDKIYHSDSIDKFNHVNSILDLEDRGTNIKANDFHDDTVLKVAYCIKEVIEKTSNKEEISSFERLKNKLPESVKNIVFSPTACIKNVRSDGYLYASSNKFRYNHERRVVSTQVGGRKNQQVFWKVDPSHGNSYIENVEFNECLHPPVNDMHSSEGRNIFTLIRRGGTQCNFWKFEPVGENVRIQDAQSGGYLYVPIHNSKHNNNGSNVGTERTKDEKSLWRFEDCRFIRNKRDIKQLESKVSLDSKTIKAKKRASGDQTSVLSEKLQRNVYLSRKPLAIDISSQPEIAASGGTRPSSWMNICISWAKNLATRTFSIIPGLPTQYSIADKNNVKNDNKNIPQTVGWNKFLNNENIALASCVADALDNIPSRRYQGLMSKGVEVVPSRRVAVDFALKKFNSFVEDKIRNLESKEQARIRVELKGAYPEIIAGLERGVEFSGNVGLDNVLEKCKKCFCTNVLPKDKVSTCLSEIGVTKLGGNLNR